MRRPHRTDERGVALSTHVGLVMVALLLMVGLVVDGGAQSSATLRCQRVASASARAATDVAAHAASQGLAPDTSEMLGAAQAVLSDGGVQGTVQLTGTTVSVHAETTVPTTFLSLITITSLRADADATATLRSTGQ